MLAATSKPPREILELFKSEEGGRRLLNIYSSEVETPEEKPHTLEQYAIEHFRPPPKRPTTNVNLMSSARKTGRDDLWRHSREPLRQPLLKKLLGNDSLSLEACNIFMSILKYMGDSLHRRSRIVNDLTDTIFSGPLNQVGLFVHTPYKFLFSSAVSN